MGLRNYYAEFPVLPYQKTTVSMTDVVEYIKTLDIPFALKIAAYVIFRIESGNGNKGVQNNYIGMQCDNGRWDAYIDKYVAGTCVKQENMTGKQRGFLCFSKWEDSVDILALKLKDRGLYAGGTTYLVTRMYIHTPEEWATAYWREWCTGNPKAIPPTEQANGLVSMYRQGAALFS